DRCEDAKLEVAKLSDETKAELKKVLPPFATIGNPVDVTAELVATPNLLKRPMEIVLADPNVDNLVIFLGLQLHTGSELSKIIVHAAAATDKRVMLNWIAPPKEAAAILREHNVPMFSDPSRGVRSLGALVHYVERHRRYVARKSGGSGAVPKAV